MADYASLKVPDLKKLLSERSLPQSGNKADLIARLQENDKSTSLSPVPPPSLSLSLRAAAAAHRLFFDLQSSRAPPPIQVTMR